MKNLKEDKKVECPYCHGSGWVRVYSFLVENKCPLCNEKGKVTSKQATDWIKSQKKHTIEW